jgi:ATP-dependent Clp protease ATP-binding subunit ClpA
MLDEVAERARALGVTLAFDAGVAAWIAEIGYAPEKGARELRHTITEQVEDAFANALLEEKIKAGEHVIASVENGKVVFSAR